MSFSTHASIDVYWDVLCRVKQL